MVDANKEDETDQFKFMLEFPNKVRVFVADEQALSKILEKSGISSEIKSSPASNSEQKAVEERSLLQSQPILQLQDFEDSEHGLDGQSRRVICRDWDARKSRELRKPGESFPGYKIRENEKGFEIVRRLKGTSYKTNISRSTVDEVYHFLKKAGEQLPVSEIEKALDISNVSIYNALKVLQADGRVHLELSNGLGRKNLSVYRAI